MVTGRNKNSIEDYFEHSYELKDVLKKNNKNNLLEKVEYISI